MTENNLKGTLNFISYYLNPAQAYISGTTNNIRAWEVDTREAYLDPNLPIERSPNAPYLRPQWEDTLPFYGDSRLFIDSDYDMIREDGFETIESVKYDKIGRKPFYKAVKYYPDNEILKRLRKASPVDFNKEMEKADARCQNKLDRMIIEDCTFSGTNNIEIPQLNGPGACNIAHHLRIEGSAAQSRHINKQNSCLEY